MDISEVSDQVSPVSDQVKCSFTHICIYDFITHLYKKLMSDK